MNPATAEHLLALNKHFYTERGHDFSATRLRLQRGVLRIVHSLRGDETILDVGCGNGELARELSRRGHKGFYLGVDLSPVLLEAARAATYAFTVEFMQADLVRVLVMEGSKTVGSPDGPSDSIARRSVIRSDWQVVTAFAVLHHIPGRDRRLKILKGIHNRLRDDGMFVHSNWQFSANPRMKERIQHWAIIGIRKDEIDAGDYLLDWRQGGIGLRYVHEFSETELVHLATDTGFTVEASFYSDGADGRSGLYQVWKKEQAPIAPR